MSGRLADRQVLVVGAGTQRSDDADAPVGNGRAIAVLAAREGAAVVCADRDEAAAEETAAWIDREGGQARVVVADVADGDACARLVEEAGAVDGLVLNVGIGRGVGLTGTSVQDWDSTFAVNLRSHFLVAQAALPRLADGAAIVFVSSVAGLQPGSRLPAYDASKAGLLGLCRHVALEGARHGVRANVVAPGTHRHAARPPRHAGTPRAGAHAGTTRPPGQRVGGRDGDGVPALGRRELHHGPGARRRRRADAAVTVSWSR